MRSAFGNGGGFNSTVFTSEKIAVLAPIPSPSATTAVTTNDTPPSRNMRNACLTSRSKVSISKTFQLRRVSLRDVPLHGSFFVAFYVGDEIRSPRGRLHMVLLTTEAS